MTDEEFGKNYFGTPVPRTKRRGLARMLLLRWEHRHGSRYFDPVQALPVTMNRWYGPTLLWAWVGWVQ